MSASQPARRGPRRHLLGSVLVIGGLLAALAPPSVLAQAAAAPDLAPWQRADTPSAPTDLELWDVIAGGPGFIAVGGGFEAGKEVGTAAIWVSEDGWAWQSVALLGDAAIRDPTFHHRHFGRLRRGGLRLLSGPGRRVAVSGWPGLGTAAGPGWLR